MRNINLWETTSRETEAEELRPQNMKMKARDKGRTEGGSAPFRIDEVLEHFGSRDILPDPWNSVQWDTIHIFTAMAGNYSAPDKSTYFPISLSKYLVVLFIRHH